MNANFDFNKFLKRKNYKQKDVAAAIKVSMGLVGTWASNKAVPSYKKIIRLIDAGITSQELFGEEIGSKLVENSIKVRNSDMEPIDYKSPEFQALVKKALIEIEAEKNGINR